MSLQGKVMGKKPQVVFERPFHRKVRPRIFGWLLMFVYLAAVVFYLYARSAHTLNLGAKYEWCVCDIPRVLSTLS